METYLRDVVISHHFSWNRSESKKWLQRNDLTNNSSRRKTARVGALVTTAVEARSKKKGKADGLNELEMILLGYYIKFRLRKSGVAHIFRNKRL